MAEWEQRETEREGGRIFYLQLTPLMHTQLGLGQSKVMRSEPSLGLPLDGRDSTSSSPHLLPLGASELDPGLVYSSIWSKQPK